MSGSPRFGRLSFGGAPLGNLFTSVAEDDALAAIDTAWNAGIRSFDTAPLYGHGLSELRVGRALRGRRREDFVISTKVGRLLHAVEGEVDGGAYRDIPAMQAVYDYSYDGTMRAVEQSLSRLGLDRIDILYIHDIDYWTHGDAQPARFAEAMAGAYPALRRLRDEGVAGAIGVGVNEWEVCEQAARQGDFDGFLLAGRYTLLEQGALDSFLPHCTERGLWVALGGPFNSGILATGPSPGAMYNYGPAPAAVLDRAARIQAICGRFAISLPAVALQFPLSHPAVATVLAGFRSAAEVMRAQTLMSTAVPSELWDALKAAGLLHAEAPTP